MVKIKILRAYFLEILLSFMLTIVATIVFSSLILYSNFEKSSATMVNTLNQDFLAETHRLNEYLQKMIKISGMELFFEPTIQKIMYQADVSNFDTVLAIRRLDSIRSMSLHTHSIYVYNAALDYIYANSNVDSNHRTDFYDTGVTELLSGEADYKRLAPIPRFIQNGDQQEPVYSFIFYQDFPAEPGIRGALVINISLDWLREIFQDNQDSRSQVLFVDSEGIVAYHSDSTRFLNYVGDQDFFTTMTGSGKPEGYFIENRADGKYLIFYSVSRDNALYLIRVYSYDILMEGIMEMRRNTWILVCIFSISAMVIAFTISLRLYRPINQIVSRIDKGKDRNRDGQSDLRYLSSSIDQMVTQTKSLQETTDSYLHLLQIDVLREILYGKLNDSKTLAYQIDEYHLPFKPDWPFYLLGTVTVDYRTLQEDLTVEFGRGVMAIDFDYQRTIIIVQQNSLDDAYRKIEKICRQLRKRKNFLVLSRKIDNASALAVYAQEILEILRFSFLYTDQDIIPVKQIVRSSEEGMYPSETEKKVLQLLHQGHAQEAFDAYKNFFLLICRHTYNHFRFSMKRLYISIQLLAEELRETGIIEKFVNLSIDEFEEFITRTKTETDVHEFFRKICVRFEQEILECRQRKNRMIIEKIDGLLHQDYANQNMCLQYICDSIGLSASYVSKLYKEAGGQSIMDRLLDIRMQKACSLLLEEECSVREIASMVGYANENYFYTVFRKHIGCTPNAFRSRADL